MFEKGVRSEMGLSLYTCNDKLGQETMKETSTYLKVPNLTSRESAVCLEEVDAFLSKRALALWKSALVVSHTVIQSIGRKDQLVLRIGPACSLAAQAFIGQQVQSRERERERES